MEELLKKILAHPANKKVLQFLKIDPQQPPKYFKKWSGKHNGFDEGGIALFANYGQGVPDDCKYSISIHNVLINPLSAEIFAFHTGRFSLFFRCDFERSGLINSDDYRRGFTFDCISDITELGENWCFLEKAEFEEEQKQLKWAFEQSQRKVSH